MDFNREPETVLGSSHWVLTGINYNYHYPMIYANLTVHI